MVQEHERTVLLADDVASEAAFTVTDSPVSLCVCFLKRRPGRRGNERSLENQSSFLSSHLLLEAALVEGLAYGAGATTVALEGYQAGATLSSQTSVVSCRR